MNTHDELREARVHPADWINPTPQGRYNLVVIGGGTAGLVTAAGAAGLGAKVALIESHHLGGDCLNVGCVPSKGLIAAARAYHTVRSADQFGVQTGPVSLDFTTAMDRMRRLRTALSTHDSAQRFRDLGVDVFFGRGVFTGPKTIEVGGQTLRFAKAVIATGARASAPPIPGLDQVDYLTNETLFDLTELPRRLAVLGAGPIGCEMAQAFARFGSEVFLIETAHGLLPKEDRDAARIVQDALERDGVKVLCCGRDLTVGQADRGVRLQVSSHDTGYDFVVDRLLVAVGRAPNVEGLGLENAGVQYNKKGVQVTDTLRTTNKNVYACGDVCSAFQFTHSADFQARTVLQNALFRGNAKASTLIIPWATYTSPELARVGLTEEESRQQGLEVTTITQPLEKVDRAILDGQSEGFVRVHLKKGGDTIVGATIVSAHAGDLIGEVTLAMKNGLGLMAIGSTIHPYPTQAEALRKAGDLYNKTRLTPFIKKLFVRWLKWNR